MYYIYIQGLYNNNYLNLYIYLTKLKYALEIEYIKCQAPGNMNKFSGLFYLWKSVMIYAKIYYISNWKTYDIWMFDI